MTIARVTSEGSGDLRADVLIVTAIQLEYDAVLKVATGAVGGSSWAPQKDRNGLPYAVRSFVSATGGSGRALRVAVACAADMSDVAATNVMLPLMDALRPKVVAMCGVCAGRPGKTALGDVVAAERLFFHDSGKRIGTKGADGERVASVQRDITTYQLRADWKRALEGIKPSVDYADAEWLKERPVPIEWQERRALAWAKEKGGEIPGEEWIAENCPQWEQVIEGLWKERELGDGTKGRLFEDGSVTLAEAGRRAIERELVKRRGRLPDLSPLGETLPFEVHVASFASGDQVVEDETVWASIADSMRKTLGLDMEAAALGALAHYQRAAGVDAIVMKAVMDFANHGRDDHFKDFAARASAECLIDFLRRNVPTEVRAGYDDLLTDGTDGEKQTHEGLAPSQLLNARNVIVPWHEQGRAEVLADLDRWVDEDANAVSVRLLHAEGGVGKTRLGIEWVRRRRRKHDVAGFLVQRPDARWLERLCGTGELAIVVIDYAESRTDLSEILERLSDYHRQEGPRTRLRVLLLARNAGDWWSTLSQRSSAVGALLGRRKAEALGPVAVREAEREAVFREAADVFAAVRGKGPVGRAPIRFDDQRFERVLYLHMAALAAVEGTTFESGTLMDVTLDHEERFWMERSRGTIDDIEVGLNVDDARELVAAATLRGGLPTAEVAREVAARLSNDGGADRRLRQLLHQIYGRDDGSIWLAGLEPDLLGEHMVLRVAVGRGGKQPINAKWIERVFVGGDEADAVRFGFTVLGRASTIENTTLRPWIERLLGTELSERALLAFEAARSVGKQTAFSVLGEVLATRLTNDGSPEIARRLERAGLPESSVTLAGVSEWVTRALHLATAKSDEDDALAEKARHANNLGNRLSNLGRREEALVASQEAVETYRTLAQRNPNASIPNFAASLHNLGVRLSELGRPEEAMVPSQEAVDTYRKLAQQDPNAFLPNFAASLNNMGVRLSELGRWEEALAPSQEAVSLRRTLALRDPETFLPDLALSLNNLGIRLSSLGRREEALVPSQEAIDIRRTLAQRNPDAFLPDLAVSLSNMGAMLSNVGRREEALVLSQEAVDLRRRLALRNPDAFLPALATSLNNVGTMLSDLGRWKEALVTSKEAVDLRRRLALHNPSTFLPDLAMSLNSLGDRFSKLGQGEEALVHSREAVDTYRLLALRNPDIFLQDLAMSLNNLGNHLGNLGRWTEALEHSQGAVDIFRVLAHRNPDAFLPNLAASLNNRGAALNDVGQQEEAIKVVEEAIEIIWPYFQRTPDAFRHYAIAMLGRADQLYAALQRQPPQSFLTRLVQLPS